jgi:hypothetical protein
LSFAQQNISNRQGDGDIDWEEDSSGER